MDKEQFIKEFCDKDAFINLVGIELLEITEEKAVLRAKIEKQHLNGYGSVHGGMLYTLADFAFGVLANYKHGQAVTQGGHINYIRAAITEEITATATETVCVGHNTVSEVLIRNAQGEIVCACTFNGFIKEVKKS